VFEGSKETMEEGRHTDDERTVTPLFWEMRLLPNDLVPILLETAGKGLVEDKRAISCVDLMTATTWPIDLTESKELDEELDRGTDYTPLMQSHLHYKMALLKPGHPGIILFETSRLLETCQPTPISVQTKSNYQSCQISNPNSRSHFPKRTPLIYFLQLRLER
jgi:hypothetical protein